MTARAFITTLCLVTFLPVAALAAEPAPDAHDDEVPSRLEAMSETGYRSAAAFASGGGAVAGAALGVGLGVVGAGVISQVSSLVPEAGLAGLLGSVAALFTSTVVGAAVGGAVGALFFTDAVGMLAVGASSGAGALGGALVGVLPGVLLFGLSIVAAAGAGLAGIVFVFLGAIVGGVVAVGGAGLGSLAGAGLGGALAGPMFASRDVE